MKAHRGVALDTELDEIALRETVDRFKAVTIRESGEPFPLDPRRQLRMARDAVFRSWQNPRAKEYRRIYDIPDAIGTAVNVQGDGLRQHRRPLRHRRRLHRGTRRPGRTSSTASS